MTKSILKLEAASEDGSTFRTTFKTKHGRMLYLSLVIQGTTCAIQDCFYLDRHQSPGRPDRQYRPQKLKTHVFPKDMLLSVIQSELDKTFYGVEFVRNGSACLPLEEYLKHKADQDQKYRFLILVGEGEYFQGLPIRLRTRLKNQLHRAIYLDLAYYKNGQGVVKQCSYYDRQYQHRAVPVTPPTLVSCFFPYTREGILNLVNQEICCDFTHILVTDGIDLDSKTTPLCGAI